MGAIKFSYEKVTEGLGTIEDCITKIDKALSENINVTSLRGSTQPALEAALNRIRTSLDAVKGPLSKMQTDVNEVKAAYAARETSIQSDLSSGTNA